MVTDAKVFDNHCQGRKKRSLPTGVLSMAQVAGEHTHTHTHLSDQLVFEGPLFILV